MVQTASDITEENVQAIQDSLAGQYQFRDKRDESTAGTYLAFVACVYGFLAIITLVTLLNIINSISMSVSARMKQYGAMRAVGMDEHQITKMILAEAFTYAFLGLYCGMCDRVAAEQAPVQFSCYRTLSLCDMEFARNLFDCHYSVCYSCGGCRCVCSGKENQKYFCDRNHQ